MIPGGNKMVSAKNYSSDRIGRTKIERTFKWRTTFNAGYAFPLWADEIYPNQNKGVDLGQLVRGVTPLGPTMDNAFLDIGFWFCPNRLLWAHWEEFIAGYNKEAWSQDVVYTKPKILFRAQAYPTKDSHAVKDTDYIHSFLDYLYGACDVVEIARTQDKSKSLDPDTPADLAELESREKIINDVAWIDALYPRAYVKIYNDWFRSEVVDDEIELYTGDSDQYTDEFAFDLLNPLELPKANKYHNRITDALPSPTKGPDVLIPMNDLQVGTYSGSDTIPGGTPVLFPDDIPAGSFGSLHIDVEPDDPRTVVARNVSNTIRMLRIATQTELLLARDARGGTRYQESLLSHFGVHNGDARLQRSEYLGSMHIPLNIVQVTNTAQGDGVLGNVGGQMMTKGNFAYFKKAFTEHGIVMAIACVRYNLSYSTGVRKMYQRANRFDHIWPEFRHVGDVKLLTREIDYSMLHSFDIAPEEVYGYTPYGSELREGANLNNGFFRGQLGSSGFAYLTYQEIFGNGSDAIASSPTLSADYLKVSDIPMSNTMAMPESPVGQFYALFDLKSVDVIPLDPTSDPGLMDHF